MVHAMCTSMCKRTHAFYHREFSRRLPRRITKICVCSGNYEAQLIALHPNNFVLCSIFRAVACVCCVGWREVGRTVVGGVREGRGGRVTHFGP